MTDKRDDAKAWLDRWDWAMAPSEIRKRKERIAKLEAKIAVSSGVQQ